MSHEELFEKYFQGTLDGAETAELKAILRDDPAGCREFVRYTQERGILIHVAGRRAGGAEEEIPEGILVEEERRWVRRSPSRILPRRRPDRAMRGPLVFAAGLLVGAVAIVALYPRTPEAPRQANRPAPVREEPSERQAEETVERLRAERRRTIDRMAAIEREKRELLESRPAEEAREDEKRRAEEDLARVEARLKEEAENLARSLELRKKAEEELGKFRPGPAGPATVAAAATVVKVEGEVTSGKAALTAGQALPAGQGVETVGAGSRATLAFADGTRVELGAATVVRDVRDRAPGQGKRFFVAQGSVAADVRRQPADQPMILSTPQGEARVLGTSLRLAVTAAATRLEVVEGRVRLTRSSDAKSVDVPADHYAVAGPPGEMVSRALLLRKKAEDFDQLPAWASSYDASWGSAASWVLFAGSGGSHLQAQRSGPGSSAQVLVFEVPANTTIDLSSLIRCPPAAGRYWVELGYRLGGHTAESFDNEAALWTLVKKFGSSGWENGNGNAWTRYSARVNTGSATRISVGFKIGSTEGAGPTAAWDTLRLSY